MRKFTGLIAALATLCQLSLAVAVDWEGLSGMGVRGPAFAPLFVGSDYARSGGNEPYMMGWEGQFYLRHGLTRRIVVDLSIGYGATYDDSTATANQTFAINNSDNAYSKLNGFFVGLTANYYFMPESKFQPYLIFGLGADAWTVRGRSVHKSLEATDISGKIGAGLNYWLAKNLSLDIQGRLNYGLANLYRSIGSGIDENSGWDKWKTRPFRGYLEPSLGLTYYFGGSRDADKDGVNDKTDQCPDTPHGAIVDNYGCPIDSDDDGAYDGLDQCPDTPKGALVDIVGCPLDSDKDGIFDGVDKCPDSPIGAAVDANGCPLDGDRDGVPDFRDKQPNTPKGAKVDSNGIALDGDGDGVPDGLDKCPTTVAGTVVDDKGCPIDVKAPVQKITLNIKYASGSFEPDAASKKTLDDLALTMNAYTSAKIEIIGFTDDAGTEKANLLLSQKRAEGVQDYLESRGVEPDRMIAKGFGEDPQYFIGDNKTAERRQINRRVEIISSNF